MHGQYNGQLSDWRARCEAAEAKHAAANIQVIRFDDQDDHQLGNDDLLVSPVVIGKLTFMIVMIINLVMMIRIKDLLFKKGISGGVTAGAGEGGGKAASRGVNQ